MEKMDFYGDSVVKFSETLKRDVCLSDRIATKFRYVLQAVLKCPLTETKLSIALLKLIF